MPPGDDEIVVNAIAGKDDETVRYRRWEKVADLPDLIDAVLAEEFGSGKDDLVAQFELSLGATRNEKGYLNFDRACSEASANWQILSVNRNGPGGSIFLNRRMKDRLRAKRLKYLVEPRLPFDDGRGRWADFVIEAQGKSWYWEHCGRLDDESYRNRWQRKLKLYAANGYSRYSEENPNGRLIVTDDGPEQGIDSPAIAELARKLFTH